MRFDVAYFSLFKCNRNRIADFPNLLNYMRELYAVPGVAETVKPRYYVMGYYSIGRVNPTGIIPKGTPVDFRQPHDRARFRAPWRHDDPPLHPPEMAAIWSPETRFRIWFEIEAHAADAMAELGIIPEGAAAKIWAKGKTAKFDIARIDEIERETKHDVIAFLTHLAEIVGPEARFVHQGMTSSDVLDTCLNVQLVRAADLLIADVEKLKRRAQAPRARIQDHADHRPLARHPCRADDVRAQARLRLRRVRPRRERADSGARRSRDLRDLRRGRHLRAGRSARRSACGRSRWGLQVEPISTQVIPRDRHAMYFATLGVVAASIERLATEIRHLQRTEVLEAEEFFSAGQKGSSAMPHKRNPVLSENLVGLARMVRAYVTPALENVALWHERDISHSSVERMIGPDATVTLDFALARLAGIIDKLIVYPDNMRQESRPPRRPRAFAARAAGADAERRRARGRLSPGAAQRHEGLGRRRRFPRPAQGRPGRAQASERQGARRQFRSRFSFRPCRHDFPPRFRPQPEASARADSHPRLPSGNVCPTHPL